MTPRAADTAPAADIPWANTVALCGRLTGLPEPVALTSGDPLWRFRVTVARPPTRDAARTAVDAVDCATTDRRVADRLGRLAVGSVVDVSGRLQRRFWRAGGAVASRYEVVVDRAKVVRRAADALSA